jgi:DNA adenine methylase
MARSSTTYPKKWNSAKTTVIRVPETMADQLLYVARRLDSTGGFRLREESNALVLELLSSKRIKYDRGQPVNVSHIPQRSPFRYPGGKTWLIPYVRDWLRAFPRRPIRLIEPFAGGAIVSLTAAFENLARHIIFSELDPGVAAVWRIVLNGQSEWLAQKILTFDLNENEVRKLLAAAPLELREKAFQTILRNRVQRGGIMAPGAGLSKSGENGKGIRSRWYPETLARRIREINLLKDRMTFVEDDGFNLIREHQADSEAAFYIDPPYTLAARRLYTKWQMDQVRLFHTAEIVELAKKFGFESHPIAMKNTHHAKMTELLIGKDLSWLRDQNSPDNG